MPASAPNGLPDYSPPTIVIAPSTTYASASWHVTDVTYTPQLTLSASPPYDQPVLAALIADFSLLKLRSQIQAQLNSLREVALLTGLPREALQFIENIRASALRLLVTNPAVRQAVVSGSNMAIATYLVAATNHFGYEVILNIQTFDGLVVMQEVRSKNITSSIEFDGTMIYLNGETLSGFQPL